MKNKYIASLCYSFLLLTALVFAGSKVSAQCHAAFTYSVNNYTKTVTFTNTSTGTGLTYLWILGSGSNTSTMNPVRTYPTVGTYYVRLFINNGTCADSTAATITITDPCNAEFSSYADSTNNKIIHYAPANTGAYLNYEWTFGDSTSSATQTPAHTYPASGTYMVCLRVTKAHNGDTCDTKFCKSVVVATSACHANYSFSVNQTTRTVTFANTSTGTGLFYYWKFGDGTVSSSLSPVKTYTANGTYNVCLIVYNSSSCIDSLCKSVTINSTTYPCMANFTYVPDSNNKKVITFAPSNTGSNLSFYWTFGDSTTSTLRNPVHTFAGYGTYNVCLRVTKAYNGDTCNTQYCLNVVTVNPNTCNAYYSFGLDSLNKKKLNFTAAMGNASNISYLWSFGDSTTATTYNPSHTFAVAGTYNVCLHVTRIVGNDTCKSDRCLSVAVGCKADFTNTTDVTDRLKVYFNNTSTSASGSSVYSWTFGDGHTSANMFPTNVYAASGAYTVCLTVHSTKDSTCNDTKCKTVTVVDSGQCNAVFATTIDSNGHKAYFVPAVSQRSNATYEWTFGDSTGASAYSTNHTYTNGSYYVCLKVRRINGNDTCKASYCSVVNIGCHADFNFSADAANKLKINFSNASTGSSLNYQWTFGQGTSGSTASAPAFTYNAAGTYTVCLVVHSAKDTTCHETKCKTVVVGNTSLCDAHFLFVRDTSNNLKVHFINPSVGDSFNFYWNFGDTTAYSNVRAPEHTYHAAGHYRVCLYVSHSNPACTASYCDTIVVGAGASSCQARFNIMPNTPDEFTFANQSVGTRLKYIWNFGDSTPVSTSMSPVHYFSNHGNYLVCLYVYDSLDPNCNDVECKLLTVGRHVNCNAEFVFHPDSAIANKMYFTPLSNFSSGTFHWLFGDGDSSVNRDPDHTYPHPGAYVVCLSLSNPGDSCWVSRCDTIYVGITGINAQQQMLEKAGIYPNPFDDHLVLDVQSAGSNQLEVVIYDITGRAYYSSSIELKQSLNHIEIETAHMPKGVYLIRLGAGGETYHKKLIK